MNQLKIDDIKKISKVKEKGVLKISWKMTRWCNYRCEYCYMSKRLVDIKDIPQEDAREIAAGINRLIEDVKRPVHLHLIGGEPTLFDIVDLLKIINSEYLKSVIIITNFSRSYEYYKEIVDYCVSRNIGLKFNASFHIEELDKRNMTMEFVDKCIALSKWISVKVMINHENKENYRPYLDKLLFNKVNLLCGTVRDEDNKCIEDPEILEFISKYNKDSYDKLTNSFDKIPYLTIEDMNGKIHNYIVSTAAMEAIEGGFAPFGFRCSIGLDCLTIDTNGDMTRCACSYGKKFGLGNIKYTYELPTKPVTCLSERNCSLCYFTDIERITDD